MHVPVLYQLYVLLAVHHINSIPLVHGKSHCYVCYKYNKKLYYNVTIIFIGAYKK